MPWRLPRWACITLPVALTLKRFLAPDLVFSLGIWLSSCRNGNSAPRGALAAKLLVRALKVLRFPSNEVTRTGIATAALDQPGDEGRAYDRGCEDWQSPNRVKRVNR